MDRRQLLKMLGMLVVFPVKPVKPVASSGIQKYRRTVTVEWLNAMFSARCIRHIFSAQMMKRGSVDSDFLLVGPHMIFVVYMDGLSEEFVAHPNTDTLVRVMDFPAGELTDKMIEKYQDMEMDPNILLSHWAMGV